MASTGVRLLLCTLPMHCSKTSNLANRLSKPLSQLCACQGKPFLGLRTAARSYKPSLGRHIAASYMDNAQSQGPQISFVRHYAKAAKKEKGKSKGGGGVKVDLFKTISLDELNDLIEYDVMCAKMQKSVEHLHNQLVEKVTVRSHPGAFDNLSINTEDGRFRLMELAQIVQKSPQLMVVNMEANTQYIKSVSNALMASGLNADLQVDGSSLFIPIPKVTREHREGLLKSAHALSTKTKDSLRNIQNKYMKDLKSNCSEKDKLHHAQEALANTFKKFTMDVDNLIESKKKELLQ